MSKNVLSSKQPQRKKSIFYLITISLIYIPIPVAVILIAIAEYDKNYSLLKSVGGFLIMISFVTFLLYALSVYLFIPLFEQYFGTGFIKGHYAKDKDDPPQAVSGSVLFYNNHPVLGMYEKEEILWSEFYYCKSNDIYVPFLELKKEIEKSFNVERNQSSELSSINNRNSAGFDFSANKYLILDNKKFGKLTKKSGTWKLKITPPPKPKKEKPKLTAFHRSQSGKNQKLGDINFLCWKFETKKLVEFFGIVEKELE